MCAVVSFWGISHIHSTYYVLGEIAIRKRQESYALKRIFIEVFEIIVSARDEDSDALAPDLWEWKEELVLEGDVFPRRLVQLEIDVTENFGESQEHLSSGQTGKRGQEHFRADEMNREREKSAVK